MGFLDLIGKTTILGSTDDPTPELVVMGFALSGLVFSVIGFWGAVYRSEPHLRLFTMYLAVEIVLDMFYFVQEVVLSGPCHTLSDILDFSGGQAFGCGLARASVISATTMALFVQGYLLFVVYSFAVDVGECGSVRLPDLLNDLPTLQKRRRDASYWSESFDPMASMAYQNDMILDGYGSFGIAAPSLGGSTHIYGHEHEVDYPPSHLSKRT